MRPAILIRNQTPIDSDKCRHYQGTQAGRSNATDVAISHASAVVVCPASFINVDPDDSDRDGQGRWLVNWEDWR